MAYAPIALIVPEYDKSKFKNWWLKAYQQGTTTPLSIATDATGVTTASKVELDTEGFPVTAGGDRFIPFLDGYYDLWLFPTSAEADANDTTNAVQFADNINADPASSIDPADIGVIQPSDTVADLVSRSLAAGVIVETKGYTTAGDGGGAQYLIKDSATVDDVGSGFTIANGKFAVLQENSPYNPLQWGVKADGTTDNQTAMQALLDFVPVGEAIALPAGIIVSDNLTIPNKEFSIIGQGRNVSILKAKTPLTNTDYFIASAAYVNNSTSGNAPITMSGVEVRGDTQAKNVFAWYGFFSDFSLCMFRDPSAVADSTAFLLTSDGISGSACASTLVENRFDSCRFDGNAQGLAYRIVDSGAKLTDGFMHNCLLYDGDVFMTTLAGWNITNNHFYGSGVTGVPDLRKLSFGTNISNNYFEKTVTFQDFSDEVVHINNNVFVDDVTIDQGAGVGRVAIMNGNNFQGAGAQLLIPTFSAGFQVVLNGGAFSNTTPVVWSNGASTTRVTMNDVFVYDSGFASFGSGYVLRGTKDAALGRHYRVFYANAAPVSGTWTRGDTVINGLPTAGGNWGFVCVTDGTPGTWKAFGTIAV